MIKENEKKIENFRKEQEENQQNFSSLKRILEILTNKKSGWYIEKNELFIKDKKMLEEYNRLYHAILEK